MSSDNLVKRPSSIKSILLSSLKKAKTSSESAYIPQKIQVPSMKPVGPQNGQGNLKAADRMALFRLSEPQNKQSKTKEKLLTDEDIYGKEERTIAISKETKEELERKQMETHAGNIDREINRGANVTEIARNGLFDIGEVKGKDLVDDETWINQLRMKKDREELRNFKQKGIDKKLMENKDHVLNLLADAPDEEEEDFEDSKLSQKEKLLRSKAKYGW